MLSSLCLALMLSSNAAGSCAIPPAIQDKLRLQRGELWAEINSQGVLVGVPVRGLCTVDGDPMEFTPGFAEWFGLSYRAGVRQHAGVGVGNAPDWAGREEVQPLRLTGDGTTASVLVRSGDMEVRTDLRFDPDGPYLLAAVTLTNVGAQVLRDILYSREGRTASPGARGWSFPTDLFPDARLPDGLMRNGWMPDDLQPGASTGVGFSYRLLAATVEAPAGSVDVPLRLFTNADFPTGFNMGLAMGTSIGDFDADGWPDILAFHSGNLWRNVDGTTWSFAVDVRTFLNPVGARYGVSFGDYNRDGWPDIATEPRILACFHLMKNLGPGPLFLDIAPDTALLDIRPCAVDSETNCWADVDGDLDLDLFIPIYPQWASGGPGNSFLRNLGPTGPGGEYRFQEFRDQGGFDNPPGSARPEGAQFVDMDGDGDLDLFSNGTIYQNQSSLGLPRMAAMTEAGSGVGLVDKLDEGAALCDYDMDGDFDLMIAYTQGNIGVKIWENRGDGTFFLVEDGVLESPYIGLGLGLSIADWDNDGDYDFTTRQVFRRNMLVETGQRRFTVASTAITGSHLTAPNHCWLDWDRDGDLDSAIGNMGVSGYFYQSELYDAGTPEVDRRYVRVRVADDHDALPRGLETEYGASVEIVVAGEEGGLRRRSFVTSSGGYVNQNEYVLHFGLPADPAPEDPFVDLEFDVLVDFPSLPSQGLLRVDRHVNAALRGVRLVDLVDREIIVYRSGAVRINGVLHAACDGERATLDTLAGGLLVADAALGLPGLSDPPTADHWVGLDIDTMTAASPLRVRQLIIDAQLGAPLPCGAQAGNVMLLDVTDSGVPQRVSVLSLNTSRRNRRSFFDVDLQLESGRHYRLIARVRSVRETPISAPWSSAGLRLNGGLDFSHPGPCPAPTLAAQSSALDPTRIFMSLRSSPIEAMQIYCTATINSSGIPARMDAIGSTSLAANDLTLTARGCPQQQFGLFLIGSATAQQPFGDGYLCLANGSFQRLRPGVRSSEWGIAEQSLDLSDPVLGSPIQSGSMWHFQFLFRDPLGGGMGVNSTDAISITFCD